MELQGRNVLRSSAELAESSLILSPKPKPTQEGFPATPLASQAFSEPLHAPAEPLPAPEAVSASAPAAAAPGSMATAQPIPGPPSVVVSKAPPPIEVPGDIQEEDTGLSSWARKEAESWLDEEDVRKAHAAEELKLLKDQARDHLRMQLRQQRLAAQGSDVGTQPARPTGRPLRPASAPSYHAARREGGARESTRKRPSSAQGPLPRPASGRKALLAQKPPVRPSSALPRAQQESVQRLTAREAFQHPDYRAPQDRPGSAPAHKISGSQLKSSIARLSRPRSAVHTSDAARQRKELERYWQDHEQKRSTGGNPGPPPLPPLHQREALRRSDLHEMVSRLYQPKVAEVDDKGPAPTKLVFQYQPDEGSFEERRVPIRALSEEEQASTVYRLVDKQKQQAEKAKRKLKEKYLAPLGKTHAREWSPPKHAYTSG
ncbi:hypothetical protein CYMTET_15419 [Cymbomonas tetramitiformis]|uniref:Uncharacterized protein n=1 Tax=Cymbomonas tetramitiformis TaxID=36881 RepID=A0AAE0GEK4_9CHLO|nr:hypothetical protein CYMTET_15419 [Cymbomonas tetramitiformis]